MFDCGHLIAIQISKRKKELLIATESQSEQKTRPSGMERGDFVIKKQDKFTEEDASVLPIEMDTVDSSDCSFVESVSIGSSTLEEMQGIV